MMTDYSQEEKVVTIIAIFKMKCSRLWKGLKKSTSKIPVRMR